MTLSAEVTPLLMTPNSTFRIARKTQTQVENVLLTLSDETVTSCGEAAPTPYYEEDLATAQSELQSFVGEGLRAPLPRTPDGVRELWRTNARRIHSQSVLAAVDMAHWDFAARKARQPLRSFCGANGRAVMETSYTVALGSSEEMAAKARRLGNCPVIKVKLGTGADLEIVRAIREVYKGRIRVDANGAWSVEKTIRLARELKALGVELIEQPLPPAQDAQMPKVREAAALPLIADESCVTERDVARCVEGFDGINIKLTKCGGITPGLRMVRQARKLHLRVMVGCMLESNVGISAGLVLGGLADYVDLDGSWLLADDPFEGHALRDGVFRMSDSPGLGVRAREGAFPGRP